MFDANDLILFVRIVDADSFTRAAERMNLPKSTLSRRLTTLEDRLGEKLFVRSTRRLVITEFGERVLEHARRLLEETEEVTALAQHRRAVPQGELRVSMFADLQEFEFAQFCAAFCAHYPQIVLRLDFSAQRVNVVGERYDIAIRAATGLPDDTILTSRRLFDMRQGLYASPGYLAGRGTLHAPQDLARHTCLPLTGSDGQVASWQLTRGADQHELAPDGIVRCNSPSLQRELALAGVGIAHLQDNYVVQALTEQGRLVRVLPEWEMPSIHVWCVMPGRRLMPARTRIFIDALKRHIESLPWKKHLSS